jgi:AmiR/NasT family two-component response regulator
VYRPDELDSLMAENAHERLRVLIANESGVRLELLERVVTGLGHEVIAAEVDAKEVVPALSAEHPDVALVGRGVSTDNALDLIGELVEEASCPVIAVLTERDTAYVRAALERGVFAYVVDFHPEDLRCAIEMSLQRFDERRTLREAFRQRAVIEQAKGILMERHGVDPDEAFELLRAQSSQRRMPLPDVAAGVVESRQGLQ